MSVRILVGDCRAILKTLPEKSAQTSVTSPPYFGLRDYGTASWDGGDEACDHVVGEIRTALGMATLGKQYRGGGHKASEPKPMTARGECPHCGAARVDSQIGLEPTPEAYVAQLVEVFREVRRVLRDDGTLWLNLGDSYASAGTRNGDRDARANDTRSGRRTSVGIHAQRAIGDGYRSRAVGLKNKDLIGIPWRVAFALQADGWYLRSDIIWHKPNPMPESVTDRPTKSHEYLFLLTKSERYYYDAHAIREPVSQNTHLRISQDVAAQIGSDRANGGSRADRPMKAAAHGGVNPKAAQNAPGAKQNESFSTAVCLPVLQRNKRSVWTVTTQGYKGAHFATFPPKLIEPCILAGSRLGDTVLDPFSGAGTTGLVADRLGRDALLIELNPEYAELARERVNGDSPLFAVVNE